MTITRNERTTRGNRHNTAGKKKVVEMRERGEKEGKGIDRQEIKEGSKVERRKATGREWDKRKGKDK